MTKIIYSLYIDIPNNELDMCIPYYGETESKSIKTKREMKIYYDWLKYMHVQYAESIGVDYILFEHDDTFKKYKEWFTSKYPMITSYNIVNFYKIHLMYKLAKQYDEILYLDFDAVPLTRNNFFESWDLDKGIAILTNKSHIDTTLHKIKRKEAENYVGSVRSPTAKYWNCRAMLIESNRSGVNDVFNTGIIGINRDYVNKLNYWENFDTLIGLMTEIIEDNYSMFPNHIQKLFGYDNETLWSYKVKMNNVVTQLLTSDWHHFMDRWNYIPAETNIVHVINKNFEHVKNWYEKNNL